MVGRKPEDWRILTPIFSMFSPALVGVLVFFTVRLINDFDKRFERITVAMEKQVDDRRQSLKEYRDWREATEQRLVKIETILVMLKRGEPWPSQM